MSALPVTGRSQRLPLMKVAPSAKVLMVSWQLLPHRPQHPALRLLAEVRQLLPVQKRAGLVRPGLAPAVQRRAVGAHEARDVRAG